MYLATGAKKTTNSPGGCDRDRYAGREHGERRRDPDEQSRSSRSVVASVRAVIDYMRMVVITLRRDHLRGE